MAHAPAEDRRHRRWLRWWAFFGGVVLVGPGFPVIVEAAPAQEPPAADEAPPEPPIDVAAELPGMARSDVLAYGEPTPDGFVIMASTDGGELAPVASLFVQGMESSMWSGWTCVTGSGRYLAAVFGPVELLRSETLRNAGAFLAVVDLVEGTAVLAPGRGPAPGWKASVPRAWSTRCDEFELTRRAEPAIRLRSTGWFNRPMWGRTGGTLLAASLDDPRNRVTSGADKLDYSFVPGSSFPENVGSPG